MKKIIFSLFALFLVCNTLMAQEAKQLKVYKNGEVTHEIALSDIDSLIFSPIKDSDSQKTHILTLKKTTGGTVTAGWTAAVGLAAGSKTSSTSADVTANVPHSAKVTFTMTPDSGYNAGTTPATITSMTGAKTVSATFVKQEVTNKIYLKTANVGAGALKNTAAAAINLATNAIGEQSTWTEKTVTGTGEVIFEADANGKTAIFAILPDDKVELVEMKFISSGLENVVTPFNTTNASTLNNAAVTWDNPVVNGVQYTAWTYALGGALVSGDKFVIKVKNK